MFCLFYCYLSIFKFVCVQNGQVLFLYCWHHCTCEDVLWGCNKIDEVSILLSLLPYFFPNFLLFAIDRTWNWNRTRCARILISFSILWTLCGLKIKESLVHFIWSIRELTRDPFVAIFNFQFSIFNFQFSIFNFQFSIFNFQFSIFNFQFSIFNINKNYI